MKRPKGLRATLLVWLLPPLVVVAMLDSWETVTSAGRRATDEQDQVLLGSARSIGERVQFTEAGIEVTVPPAAIELLDAGYGDRVLYRVADAKGRLLAGSDLLAKFDRSIAPEDWAAFDATIGGEPVRIVSFVQPLFDAPNQGPIEIEVAQTLHRRNDIARVLWMKEAGLHFSVVALVAVLIWFGLRRGLAPVDALRERILRRTPGAIQPLDDVTVPTELAPIVDAFNHYVARLREQIELRGRFLADASHQLRTPLTLLNTQVEVALRLKDDAQAMDALRAIQRGLRSNIRLVNQLLSIAETDQAEGHALRKVPVDLVSLVAGVLEQLALLAEERRIDLGLDADRDVAMVAGDARLLHMLVTNLVDNALRYSPRGGMVTAEIRGSDGGPVLLRVIDNGPGIPAASRARVFERFHRVLGHAEDGCGLGLSIVKDVADAHGATVTLDAPTDHDGLVVTVAFPS